MVRAHLICSVCSSRLLLPLRIVLAMLAAAAGCFRAQPLTNAQGASEYLRTQVTPALLLTDPEAATTQADDISPSTTDPRPRHPFTIIPLGAELLEYIGAHHFGVFPDWDCDDCSPRWYDWWCYACHKQVPARWTVADHYSVCGQLRLLSRAQPRRRPTIM